MPKEFNILALLPTFSSLQMALLKQTAKLRYKIKYGTSPSDPANLFNNPVPPPKKGPTPNKTPNTFLSSIVTSTRNVLYDDSLVSLLCFP